MDRIAGERGENVERAIQLYHKALERVYPGGVSRRLGMDAQQPG